MPLSNCKTSLLNHHLASTWVHLFYTVFPSKIFINLLKGLQNRASHFISSTYTYSIVTQIKFDLSSQPLSTCRDTALLSYTGLSISNLKEAFCTSWRPYNQFSYTRIYDTTHAFNFSALPHAIRLCNALPNNIVSQSSHTTFRSQLVKHFAVSAI